VEAETARIKVDADFEFGFFLMRRVFGKWMTKLKTLVQRGGAFAQSDAFGESALY
jgi:hypothetical protein